MGNSSSDSHSKANDKAQNSANKTHHHHLLDLFHLHHHHFLNKSSAKQPDVEPEVESYFRVKEGFVARCCCWLGREILSFLPFKWLNEQTGQQPSSSQSKVIPTISFKKITVLGLGGLSLWAKASLMLICFSRHVSRTAQSSKCSFNGTYRPVQSTKTWKSI